MSWQVITFDLDKYQPPGIEPQIQFYLEIDKLYVLNHQPVNFALFDLHSYENQTFKFYFSPVAADICKSLIAHYAIQFNAQLTDWDKSLPETAQCRIGTDSIRWNDWKI